MLFFEKAIRCGCVCTIEYPPKPSHPEDIYCSDCGANLGSGIRIGWPPSLNTN